MKVIMAGNIDAKGNRISWCDYQQILDRLPYKTTRESLMCSMRILVNLGWVIRAGKEIRDGRARQTVEPSPAALRILGGTKSKTASYAEVLTGDVVEIVLEEELGPELER